MYAWLHSVVSLCGFRVFVLTRTKLALLPPTLSLPHLVLLPPHQFFKMALTGSLITRLSPTQFSCSYRLLLRAFKGHVCVQENGPGDSLRMRLTCSLAHSPEMLHLFIANMYYYKLFVPFYSQSNSGGTCSNSYIPRCSPGP